MIKKTGIIMSFVIGALFLGNDVTMAGGCYQPRVSMAGTVKAKQAVYLRTMPCMEEGSTVATAKSQEVMTVSTESDGRYQVTRSDGTVGRIYYTWLTDINVSKSATTTNTVATTTVYQAPTISASDKKVLDSFIVQLYQVYPSQADYYGNLTRHSKVEEILQKLIFIKDKSQQWKMVIEYLINAIESK